MQVRFRLSADSLLSMYSHYSWEYPTASPFGSGLSATLARSALTTFISDSHYINHTAQAWLPSYIVANSLSPSSHDFGLNPDGRGYVVTPASSQPLPAASVALGYCQWNGRFGQSQTVQLCDLVSHKEIGIMGVHLPIILPIILCAILPNCNKLR